MLDNLRGTEVHWLFSVQYKPPTMYKGYRDQKKRLNDELGHTIKIKDYYTYYTGFLADFVLEGKYYVSSYDSSKKYKDVYVILIDRKIKIPDVGKTNTTTEMFITNVDCTRITPYNGLYVQLPIVEFLDFIEKYRGIDVHAEGVKKTLVSNSQYDEIVEFAKERYRANLKPV
jgi:hypothetical protein